MTYLYWSSALWFKWRSDIWAIRGWREVFFQSDDVTNEIVQQTPPRVYYQNQKLPGVLDHAARGSCCTL